MNESKIHWLATGFLLSPEEFSLAFNELDNDVAVQLIWALRDLSGHARRRPCSEISLSCMQIEQMLRLIFIHFKRSSHPSGGWCGDKNAWDATDYALRLLSLLSTISTREAATILQRLLMDPVADSYSFNIKHAIAQQQVRMVDSEFQQPDWASAVASLANGIPAGISDLHALLLDHLNDLGIYIAASNVDVFKRFWNEDSRGRVTSPKIEDSCRDILVELLRNKTKDQGLAIEPEGHMANDKRADMVVQRPGMKLVIELKRDSHPKVWNSIQDQLERFYTRDPEARGFGIYAVFWFGDKRNHSISSPPVPIDSPKSAKEMQMQLTSLIAPERRRQVAVVVLDVSGEIPSVER